MCPGTPATPLLVFIFRPLFLHLISSPSPSMYKAQRNVLIFYMKHQNKTAVQINRQSSQYTEYRLKKAFSI